jgi:hypothetical protein
MKNTEGAADEVEPSLALIAFDERLFRTTSPNWPEQITITGKARY